MSRKTRNVVELEEFLAEFVTPHLQAVGFRKSHHTYRLRRSNGDEAVFSFRGWPVGTLCSFLFDVWVVVEPCWDLAGFDLDRPAAYPKRTQSWDATFHRQLGPDPQRRGNWQWQSIAGRDQVGHAMRDLLLGELLPAIGVLLDRSALLDAARRGERFLGLQILPRVYRSLLVDAGPSDELDAALLAADSREPEDAHLLAWAAVRLTEGPAWRGLVAAAERRDDTTGIDLEGGT